MGGLQGALLDALLKGSLLLILAALACRLLRHRSAAARHAIWTTALLGQLALPVLSAKLPTWDVALLPSITQSRPAGESGAGAPVAQANDAAAGSDSVFRRSLPSIPTVLGALWIMGGLALVARLLFGVATVARLARRAGAVSDGPWPSLTRYLAAKLRIGRPIRLLRSDQIGVPVTWGIRRPTVLLPAGADSWSAERRGLVLVHELAHIKRFDALTQLAAQGALAVFWVNPLVWIALRQMAAERERACDDYVLRHGAMPSTYATELLDIVRSLEQSPGPALTALALGFARRSEFEGRMLAILSPRLSRRTLDRRTAVFLGVLAALLIVPLAAFRPVRKEPATSTRTAKSVIPTPTLVTVSPTELATIETPVVGLTRRAGEVGTGVDPRRSGIGTSPSKNGARPAGSAPARAVPKRPAPKKAADNPFDGPICLMFAMPVSRTESDGREPQLSDTAPKTQHFQSHGVPSDRHEATSACHYNINIVKVSRGSTDQEFQVTVAFDDKGIPFTPEIMKARATLRFLVQDGELLDLLRRLTPVKET